MQKRGRAANSRSTTRGQHCSAPPRHRLNQISHIVSWYCSPFLLQHLAKLIEGLRCRLSLAHMFIQLIPQVFNGIQVRRFGRPWKRFSSSCVQEVDSFGGGSVMMWTAISNDRKTDLVHVPGNLTAVRYTDEILQPHRLSLAYMFFQLIPQVFNGIQVRRFGRPWKHIDVALLMVVHCYTRCVWTSVVLLESLPLSVNYIIRPRRPYFGAVLTLLHRHERVQWCNRLRGWTFRNWRRIWFSDESSCWNNSLCRSITCMM
jgi:hypothetical protein